MPSRHHLVPMLLCLTGLACEDRPPSGPIPVHPVSGQVTYRGRPVPDALVAFHRVDHDAPSPKPGEGAGTSSPTPTGRTNAEGQFRLHTYVGDDGAPIGDYKVTVALAAPSEGRNFMAKVDPKAMTLAIPPKYTDPARSGLTATVQAGDNTIPPFDLK